MTKPQIQAMLDGKWLINNDSQKCFYNENEEYPFRFLHSGKGQSEEMRGAWESNDWEIIDAPKKEYQFKAFDKVLVRDGDNDCWRLGLFENFDSEDEIIPFFTTEKNWYEQCIPYEGNERLLGTMDKE
jgi:hypothetical protein